jgi:glycosyltransferase involved in cell wall biosynthesis
MITDAPLISCIVPVHNGERYLAETLDSLAAQSHRPIELIVVDDGSTDGSLQIARHHAAGVRCVSQPQSGHGAARNAGVVLATGAFVAFIDADDLWDPSKLARQLAAFDARPALGVVCTHLQNFVSPDRTEDGKPAPVGPPVPGYAAISMLARRSLFETIGLLDPSLAHANDREWLCRVAEAGIPMEMLPDVLVHRRLHGGNRSQHLAAASRSEYLRLLKGTIDRRRRAGTPDAQYPFGAGQ